MWQPVSLWWLKARLMHTLNEAVMEIQRYPFDLGELLIQHRDYFKTTYRLSPGQ